MTATETIEPGGILHRVRRFLQKPRREKFRSFYGRWLRIFPKTPMPVRLPFGAWWLMDRDFIGESLLEGGYETAESELAVNFLKPGMTVLDIGAHRGFHTLLFSEKVGKHGRVLSFEPSPPDRRRLELHLKINFCHNVEVIECALGEEDGSANLYAVPSNSVLNSLRPPDTAFQISATPVLVRKLDDVLLQTHVKSVDFIKLDVEGGELGVLKGAQQLISRVPRPVILCEVLQETTRLWGYPAHLIVDHLSQQGFVWFELNEEAELVPIRNERSDFHGNFIAVPTERLPDVADLRAPTHGNSRAAGN